MIANVNWQYIILRSPSNGVYRVKKRADGPPPVTDMGLDAVNNDFWSKTAPPDQTFNGAKYVFAFWSITGQDTLSPQREAHVEVGKTASSSHPGQPNMGGGAWIVTAKAYYVAPAGNGTGGHNGGVFIDAFDIQAGDFIPDDFVDVTPDDQAKTLTGNANNGYIDTTAQIGAGNSIKITARDSLPTSKSFGYWQEIASVLFSANPATPVTVGAPDLHDIVAHKDDVVYAFAFYNELPPPEFKKPGYYAAYDPWWWIRTHGGRTPPLPDPEPWMPQYEAVIALAMTAQTVSPKLKSGVLKIALEQLSITSATIKNEIKTGGL